MGTSETGCEPSARFFVGGEELPVASANDVALETHIRKAGASIKTRSDVSIPVTWGKNSAGNPHVAADKINAFVNQGNPHQHATVEVLDERSGEYEPVQHGYISAAGSGSSHYTVNVRVSGYESILDTIAASKTFQESASAKDVVKYVVDTLLSEQGIIEDVNIASVPSDVTFFNLTDIEERVQDYKKAVSDVGIMAELAEEIERLRLQKRFRADRHTLADVLNWIAGMMDSVWYFSGGNPPTLVIEERPQSMSFYDSAHVDPESSSARSVTVLSNNALYEISPQYRVKARGHTKKSIRVKLDPTVSSKGYPTATATYEALADRASGSTQPPVIGVDATTTGATETLAKQELLRVLDSAAGGSIELKPTPRIRPYASLRTVPVCGHRARMSLPPITFESEEVIHYHPGNAREEVSYPQTVVRPSLFVDPRKVSVTSTVERV